MRRQTTVAMLGSSDPYGRYALAPSYAGNMQGMHSYIVESFDEQIAPPSQSSGYPSTAESAVSEMSSREKADFFKDILSQGAEVAIAALNKKQADSTKAAEIAELETAKALIAAGKGDKLTGDDKEDKEQDLVPYFIIGGAVLAIGVIMITAKQRRRRR